MINKIKRFALFVLTAAAVTSFSFSAGAQSIMPPATADNINPGTYMLICAALLAVVIVLIIFSVKNRKK